jgi:hypothetical protein
MPTDKRKETLRKSQQKKRQEYIDNGLVSFSQCYVKPETLARIDEIKIEHDFKGRADVLDYLVACEKGRN